jgi:peptide/nickel transport system ATP-binding protein
MLSIPLISLRGVSVSYGDRTVLSILNFNLYAGARIGIAGRSGSGKSTLARLITLHQSPTQGIRLVDGQALQPGPTSIWRSARRRFQLVTQDPANSFVPRWTVSQVVEEALRTGPYPEAVDVRGFLEQVRLPESCWGRHPLELSGGQRCRLALARALACRPSLLVLDETLTPLDGPLRKEMCELLEDIQRSTGLALLTISHDLRLLRSLCNEWIILKEGAIAEQGPRRQILLNPQSAETQSLLSASFLNLAYRETGQ